MKENVETINAFLFLYRQIKFDTAGRIMDADVSSVVSFVTARYEKEKWKELIDKVIFLIRKVGIPKYQEAVDK